MAKPSTNYTGRRSGNLRHWQAHVKAVRECGLSRAEYCRQHNLSYHALTYWYSKISTKSRVQEMTLVPISLDHNRGKKCPPSKRTALKVILPDNTAIEVCDNFSPDTLTRLLATLENR